MTSNARDLPPSSSRRREGPKRRKWPWLLLALVLLLITSFFFGRSALWRRARKAGVDIQTLNWNSLRAQTANRAIPGGLGRLHAIGLEVNWADNPIRIDIEHLDFQAPESQINTPAPPKSAKRTKVHRQSRRSRELPEALRTWLDEKDWDIRIKNGPRIQLSENRKFGVSSIRVLRKDSKISLSAKLDLPSKKEGEMRCALRSPLSWTELDLECSAPVLFSAPFSLRFERQGRKLTAHFLAPKHEVFVLRDGEANTWEMRLKEIPMTWWSTAYKAFSLPALQILQFAPGAKISTDFKLSAPRLPHESRALTLKEFDLHGLIIQEARFAPDPLEFGRIQAQGEIDLALRRRESHEGKLDLQLADFRVSVGWKVLSQKHQFEIRVPDQNCQSWIDAIPPAMRPALAGLALDGQSSGALLLEYDPEKRSNFEEGKSGTEPGTLHFEFPFFERCKVVQEPTIFADHSVSSSKYLHHWQGSDAKLPPRLMGSRNKDFLVLRRMPQFSKAMTVTEDPNFWEHNGFDPYALRSAFWYDLSKRKIARGASTISQQCARMLWLGTQRNLARKLQEVILTWRLEENVSKNRILELYLNLIKLGPKSAGGPTLPATISGSPCLDSI